MSTRALTPAERAELSRIFNTAQVHLANGSVFLRCKSAEQADRALALLALQGRAPARLDALRLSARATAAQAKLGEQIADEPRNRCPHCSRSATECWSMPCLQLESIMRQGAAAVNRWAAEADAPFRVQGRKSS